MNYAYQYRRWNDITQDQAAAIIGISVQAYGPKEKGEVDFKAEEIRKFCAALKDEKGQPLTPNKFIYGPAGKPPDQELMDGLNKEDRRTRVRD